MALARKNLVVDPERVRALAQRRGTSESAAVREAVEVALAAEEVMSVIRDLHDRDAFADAEAWYARLEEQAD